MNFAEAGTVEVARGQAFRLGWRGYDRSEVDLFLAQTAADRERLSDNLGRLDRLAADHPNDPAATLALALREAQEIWATAEARAQRLIREAEAYAASLRHDAEAAHDRQPWTLALTTLNRFPRGRFYGLMAIVPLCAFVVSGLIFRLGAGETPVLEPAQPLAGVAPSKRVEPATAPAPVPARTSSPVEQPVAMVAAVSLPSEGLVVTLTAERPCWIRTTVDEHEPVERLLRPAETILLHFHSEAVLRVGDAAALSMLINHWPAKALGGDGQVVTRRITRTNYATFLAEPASSSQTSLARPGPSDTLFE